VSVAAEVLVAESVGLAVSVGVGGVVGVCCDVVDGEAVDVSESGVSEGVVGDVLAGVSVGTDVLTGVRVAVSVTLFAGVSVVVSEFVDVETAALPPSSKGAVWLPRIAL
jgi:hypothetical protein